MELRRRGHAVESIDTKVGGAHHDVLRPEVAERIEARVRARYFDGVFLATPCQSFSIAHRPQLRSRAHPLGLPSVPEEWRAYLDKHNRLAAWSARVAHICHGANVPIMIENPADRGDESSPAHWPRMADHAPLSRQPDMVAWREETGAKVVVLAQCEFGAQWQKYTEVQCSADILQEAQVRLARRCTHTHHAEHSYGRHANGAGKAEQAAAYPRGLSAALADVLESAHTSRTAQSKVPVGGGRVADGAALAPFVAARVAAAEVAPPKYASMRNLAEASHAELIAAPMPGDLAQPMRPTKPLKAKAAKGPALPAPTTGGEAACDEQTMQPEGKIHVSQLWGVEIYELEIVPWRELAGRAAWCIEHGTPPPKVPTLRIPQSRMPAWARGKVWDCFDEHDCKEVERSTRDTVFPGRRQANRGQLRAIARELRWHDRDIVNQVGEGGVEPRSACDMDSVFAFHHRGVAANLAAVRQVMDTHKKEEWITPILPHPPMVPCKCIPRNVVMQERMRASTSGELETYLKPRVTSNSSFGGPESVNGGVPQADRYVRLPTVQDFGRGAAIVNAATSFDAADPDSKASTVDDGGAAPEGTASGSDGKGGVCAVDLESAYSFLVIQRADWWTQVFFWWEWVEAADGSRTLRIGFAIDTRLGFGGAFAPNRFERVTLMLGAWIQQAQAAFDEAHPYPPRVRAWIAHRRELQRQGRLPEGEGQVAPRYLQVYIDDYNLSATTDEVDSQHEYAHVDISEVATLMSGGCPPARTSRLWAHAQITVHRVRRAGFADSPGKTCLGDGIGSLGFKVMVKGGRICCPSQKRNTMIADIDAQTARAERELIVDVAPAGKLLGRMINLAQIFPEIRSYLHGGYAVASGIGPFRSVIATRSLAEGRGAQVNWLCLLEESKRLLQLNAGVPLAASARFAPRDAPNVFTSTTDASGIDGVGGYVFIADRPGEVWLVSERWPDEVLAALAAAASQGAARAEARSSGVDMLSVTAAELIGAWAVPQAVARSASTPPRAVYAIGDNQSTAAALNSATGGNAQMRVPLAAARALCSQWLGVHVPREANVDADRLSHPAQAMNVALDAARAGLVVHEARMTMTEWSVVREAAAAGVGGGAALPRPEGATLKRKANRGITAAQAKRSRHRR